MSAAGIHLEGEVVSRVILHCHWKSFSAILPLRLASETVLEVEKSFVDEWPPSLPSGRLLAWWEVPDVERSFVGE